MRLGIGGIGLLLALGGAVFSSVSGESRNAFDEILQHYESIRLSLLGDELGGLEENARAIAARVDELLAGEFEPQRAGVSAESSDEFRALLPELTAAALRLAESEGIEAARDAFFELSKPLGRYRKLAGTDGSVVAYCPMAKKAWIQPPGGLGNPYMGQKMAKCGNTIAD